MIFSLASLTIITLIIEQSNNNDHQVKDVRVPEQLQRAMAAEAEAAREARAKVENGDDGDGDGQGGQG